MSLFLHRLGGAIAQHRGLVVAVWGLLLAALIGGSGLLGTHYDDSFSIPGTDSQQGQDLLADRFDQTGATGQILFTADSGKITDPASSQAVAAVVKKVDGLPHVTISNPLTADTPVLNQGSTSTLAQVRFSAKVPTEATLDSVVTAARPSASEPLSTAVGGDAYKSTPDTSHLPELLGLLVSFLILAITFGSLVAAGMPILTSLIGVGVTLSAVVLTSSLGTVSSSAPTLAEMLGLAVGIDYALFILSRHRLHLAEGLPPAESMQRSLATAGSAVVFAGATVIIALTGLAVARIPVLTVMGLAAAFSVAIAVLIALTLLPAIALLLGDRIRPRPKRVRTRPRRTPRQRTGLATRWVHLVTKWPIVTVLAVLGILVLSAKPGSDLHLALPDNSTAPTSSMQRQTYDKITAAFGEGYNAPLSITANVITSSNPKDTVNQIAGAVKGVPDVVGILQATPNEGGDTALIQAIPSAGQTAASTKELVQELRERTPGWEKEFKVDTMLVTGQTAINIDVSDRLASALLPFAAIVIGLSLILLMVVFRSIAVPLKATFGYLLSVGAALGAVVVVFQWGWLPGLSTGPIVSFLPIFVMGVLFGLAMDYEMFLVSAMREEYVLTRDAREAVYGGFRASSKVVTAAALIMCSVFVAFIPSGSATIKPIALGLAVGVFVDAFVVRMTFVPAVLMLLGDWAWWLPRWLDRRVPVVDVEGAVLHRRIAFQDWEAANGETTLLARDLVVRAGGPPVQLVAVAGRVHRLDVPAGAGERELGQVLTGRTRAAAGSLVVAGNLLPEQREAVNRRATLVELDRPEDPLTPPEDEVAARARLVSFSLRQRHAFAERASDLVDDLSVAAAELPGPVLETALALAGGVEVIVYVGLERLPAVRLQEAAEALGDAVAARGATVVLLGRGVERAPAPPLRTDALAASAAGGNDD